MSYKTAQIKGEDFGLLSSDLRKEINNIKNYTEGYNTEYFDIFEDNDKRLFALALEPVIVLEPQSFSRLGLIVAQAHQMLRSFHLKHQLQLFALYRRPRGRQAAGCRHRSVTREVDDVPWRAFGIIKVEGAARR